MKKKQNKKGFTLAELLIVVAIIGVLVAISIPIFSSNMKKARLAVNQANARAAYAAWAAEYMEEGMPQGVRYYTYHTSTGKLENMGAINFGCAVSSDWYAKYPITDISEWKTGTHANITDRTLGSDVYEYWQMQVIDGKVMAYYALRNPAGHY